MSMISRTCLIVLTLCISAVSAAADTIPWSEDVEHSLQQAQSTGRLALLDFTASWCVYCKRMEQTTFMDPAIVRSINADFIAIRVDAEKHKDVVQQLEIKGLPTILVVTPDLTVVDRITGFQTVEALSARLAKIVREHRPATQPHASAFAATANQPAAEPPHVDWASPDFDFDAAGNTGAPRQPATAAAQDRAFRPVSQSQQTNPFEQPTAAPQKGHVAGHGGPLASPAPVSARQQPAAPAFDGLCITTAVDERRLLPGDPLFTLDVRGHTLQFQSEAHRRRFLENPDKYWPMLDGICPVTLAETGERREGQFRYAAVFRKRIWLFCSEDHMQSFLANPAELVEAVVPAE